VFRDYEICDAQNKRKCSQNIHHPILSLISNYRHSLYLGHFIVSSRPLIEEYGDKTWGLLWLSQHWNQSSICVQSKGTINRVCHTYNQFSENKRCNNLQNLRYPIFILSLRAGSETESTFFFLASIFFNRLFFSSLELKFLLQAEDVWSVWNRALWAPWSGLDYTSYK